MGYLLIYEFIPEETRLYHLPDNVVADNLELLLKANGQIVNVSDDWRAASDISDLIQEGSDKLPQGDWVRYRIKIEDLPKTSFRGVFFAGFYL